MNQQLLEVARDYFHFVTNFFEMIKVSATHIYHSALELSPTSSLIREHYHCQPFRGSKPRVVYGLHSSWDQPATIRDDWYTYAWSPCGQFFSRLLTDCVEVREALTLEKHSELHPIVPNDLCNGALAYSPDGCSLAGYFGHVITIWDIQTGGVVKEIEPRGTSHLPESLVWSLDETTISTISKDEEAWVVSTYDVASEAEISTSMLLSRSPPCIWPHNNTVQAMTILVNENNQAIINILKAHPIPTNELIESFPTKLKFNNAPQISFSPSTYRISVTDRCSIFVFNIWNPTVMLQKKGRFHGSWFSPDGMFLAASRNGVIHVWKYTPEQARYIQWGEFPSLDEEEYPKRQMCEFSPHSSSMLVFRGNYLELQHLEVPPTDPLTDVDHYHTFSADGAYVVTAAVDGDVITITNLHNNSSVSFDMGLNVNGLALTGNVLLIDSFKEFSGWLITAEHTLDRVLVFGDIECCEQPEVHFWAEGSVGILKPSSIERCSLHVPRDYIYYNTETGEELEFLPTEAPLYPPWKRLEMHGSPHEDPDPLIYSPLLHDKDLSEGHLLVSKPWYDGGWVKYPEGEYQHQFWLPNRWRPDLYYAYWLGKFTVLQMDTAGGLVIIKF